MTHSMIMFFSIHEKVARIWSLIDKFAFASFIINTGARSTKNLTVSINPKIINVIGFMLIFIIIILLR